MFFFLYSICILLLLLQENSVNNHQSKILRRFILDSELKKTKLQCLMKKKRKLNYSKKKKKEKKIHVPTLALKKDVRGLIFLSTCDCVMFLKTALLLPISLLNTLCRNFHDYISMAIRTCVFIDSEFFVCPSYRFYPSDISLEKEILEIRRWKKYVIMHLNKKSDFKRRIS